MKVRCRIQKVRSVPGLLASIVPYKFIIRIDRCLIDDELVDQRGGVDIR